MIAKKSSKANNLLILYRNQSKFYVPKFLVIFKSELNNKLKLQNKIKRKFKKNDKLIIRSSSLNEDNKKQ